MCQTQQWCLPIRLHLHVKKGSCSIVTWDNQTQVTFLNGKYIPLYHSEKDAFLQTMNFNRDGEPKLHYKASDTKAPLSHVMRKLKGTLTWTECDYAPVNSSTNSAMLMSNNNVWGYGSRLPLSIMALYMNWSYQILNNCRGNWVQPCCWLIVHNQLQPQPPREYILQPYSYFH